MVIHFLVKHQVIFLCVLQCAYWCMVIGRVYCSAWETSALLHVDLQCIILLAKFNSRKDLVIYGLTPLKPFCMNSQRHFTLASQAFRRWGGGGRLFVCNDSFIIYLVGELLDHFYPWHDWLLHPCPFLIAVQLSNALLIYISSYLAILVFSLQAKGTANALHVITEITNLFVVFVFW